MRGSDLVRAALLFEQAAAAARRAGEVDLLADALNGLAGLEHAHGDSQGAIVHLEEALTLRERQGDPGGAAVALGNLGAVYLDLGHFNRALEHLLRADTLCADAAPARAASVAANLSRVYEALQMPDDALTHSARALALAREAGHPVGEGIVAVNRADLLRRQGHLAEVEALLQRALTLSEGSGTLAASALRGLGRLRQDEGRLPEALSAFREALRLAGEEGDLDELLSARLGVADVLLDLERHGEALALLNAAGEEAQGGERARVAAQVLALRARAAEGMGDLPGALTEMRQAHAAEVRVLQSEAERRTRELLARGELQQARARLEREQARYEAEREAKEKLAREQAARLEELERLALYDALTGLPNRLLLAERARTALEGAALRGHSVALGVLDLDKFKAVNDTHGHHVGDLLLVEVARRVEQALGPGDTVARTGGDEFVFLIGDAGEAGLPDFARRALQTFHEPFFLDGVELNMRPSLGFARYPEDAADLPGLLERADHAMYRAKARGSGFELSVGNTEIAPVTLEAALHGAVRAGELHLVYQPLEDAVGRWAGAEALLRWRSPVYGNVTPDQFMPLAERSGLSLPLGDWTLSRACQDLARLPGLSVAVNVSARQLLDPDLPARVRRAADRAGIECSRLLLEVREEVVARTPERAREALTALAEVGVRLTLDDFGGGYANFAELARLPLHGVKLARALLPGAEASPRAEALLEAVVHLARALDLQVIAKGVETEAQREHLRRLGISRMQGFLVSSPVEPGALRHRPVG